MPRYRIDTDTLIAACLEKEPYAALSLFDMRAIVNLAANTQGRYLFCDTSPAALEQVLSVCRSLYTAPTNISVALKKPDDFDPPRMFFFGYDDDTIHALQTASQQYLLGKAEKIAEGFLRKEGCGKPVSDMKREQTCYLVSVEGETRQVRVNKQTWTPEWVSPRKEENNV